MKQNFFYIKVRVELDTEVSDEQLEEIAQELDYTITSKTDGIKVIDTEIEANAKDYDFEDEF